MENKYNNILLTLRYFKVIFGLALLVTFPSLSQVVIGGTELSNAAMLEVHGTNDGGLTYRGLMPPRVPSVAIRDAMIVPDTDRGMVIFVTDIQCLQIYNGVSWESINCLGAVTNTVVNFSQQNITVGENIGGLDFDFLITNPSPTATIDVTISIVQGYDDVIETGPQTFTIPMNVASFAEPALFSVFDDALMESDETLTFIISNVTGGTSAIIGATNTDTVTITDNDTTFTSFVESFETDGNGTRYTLSATEGADAASDDYFIRTDGTEITYNDDDTVLFTGSPDGSYFFAAQDIDGVTEISTGSLQTMIFTGIDITSGINLELDILIAEDDSTGGSPEHWDELNDSFIIQYQIDGGGYQNLFAIEGEDTASGFNGLPRIDADFDGMGEGTIITNAWTDYNASITGTGLLLDLRIQFDLGADGEDIAIDNIRITSN